MIHVPHQIGLCCFLNTKKDHRRNCTGIKSGVGQRSGLMHEGCSSTHGVTVNGVSTSEIFLAHLGLASTLDYTTFEPREFIAQNGKVVSLVYAEQTVRNTGRSFVNHEAHVWTFRDGKVARFQIYLDTAAAAAAHRVE